MLATLEDLSDQRRELFKIQRRYRVMLPILLEDELIGLVEQWALGAEWSDLSARTSLDAGDVVRMVRRTLDLLSQVIHVPYLAGDLKDRASEARALLDRFPVSETVD